MRVLLVEDDRALTDSVSSALKLQGHVVDTTQRGEPVEKSVETDYYDAVILDVGLPGIDGFEVLRRIRKRGNVTPVVPAGVGVGRGLSGGTELEVLGHRPHIKPE